MNIRVGQLFFPFSQMNAVKKYFVVFQKSLKSETAYRAAALAGIAGTLFSFSIRTFLWKALLGVGVRQDTSFSDMLLYVIINSVLFELTSGNVAEVIQTAIIDGTISMELLRPMSFKYYSLANILGKNVYGTLTRTIPILIIGLFLVSPSSLPDISHALLFVVSALLGILLMFEITYLVGLLAFWLQRCWFLRIYLRGFRTLFGGTTVPLWFYPDWLRKVSHFLPFRCMTFEPINFFLQKTALADAWIPLLTAFLWLFGLSLFDKLVWRAAIQKLAINGG